MIDRILDWAGDKVNPARRDAAMERAHAKGLDACEVCGRALQPGAQDRDRGLDHVGPRVRQAAPRGGAAVTRPLARTRSTRRVPVESECAWCGSPDVRSSAHRRASARALASFLALMTAFDLRPRAPVDFP